MMDSLRTAANSLVLKIIFGIIIVSFILTGVSGYLIGGGNNYAAKVNDQEISRGQFENAFNSERNRMQQQLGDQYSELAVNEGYMKTLRQQVLNRLIDEAPRISTRNVAGPSLTSSTSMCSLKTPVATATPSRRRFATRASTSGSARRLNEASGPAAPATRQRPNAG